MLKKWKVSLQHFCKWSPADRISQTNTKHWENAREIFLQTLCLFACICCLSLGLVRNLEREFGNSLTDNHLICECDHFVERWIEPRRHSARLRSLKQDKRSLEGQRASLNDRDLVLWAVKVADLSCCVS